MDADFFSQRTNIVAEQLIGKILVVRHPLTKLIRVARIIETEAYRTNDIASHCRNGWTPRCAPMFEDPGYTYVYFIYGMHVMLNVVTEPRGIPGAVLIRALEPHQGFPDHIDFQALSGPGKLTRELEISMADNRQLLGGQRMKIKDDGVRPEKIIITPRIGIHEPEIKRPWRFCWANHPALSRACENEKIFKSKKPKW